MTIPLIRTLAEGLQSASSPVKFYHYGKGNHFLGK